MGRVLATGIDGLIDDMDSLAQHMAGIAAYALYPGAGVMADAVKDAAGGLPYKGSTVAQIQAAVGIHTFKDTDDGSATSIGFDGYFAESGFPIQFFVREVEGGTSKIPAHPFVRKAAGNAQAAAEAAIVQAAEEKINEYTGGK